MEFAALDIQAAFLALGATAGLAVIGWLISLARNDVSIVDSLWSLMFLASLGVYMLATDNFGWRALLVLALTAIWAVRLSAHIALRGLGEPEDRRYREIRANHQPHFRFKSIYIVFGLQAVLAWLISMPLLAATATAPSGFTLFDAVGILLWLSGMFFEVVGDAQLQRFRNNAANRGKVLDSGLWRYTRHPNYFGEFLLQWGFFALAISAGGAWTVFAPVLMSFLLLRVSGVALLEKDIGERRPEYRHYIKRTNAFFPGPPRQNGGLALLALLALTALPGAIEARDADREWNFRVLVDEKPVGHHRFALEDRGEVREISSAADFEYQLLFLTLYDYQHDNREIWQGECLQRIDSRTDDNGKQFSVDGRQKADAFVLDRNTEALDAREILPGCVRTFAYWDLALLKGDRLLNSQTGVYMDVNLSEPVPDRIEVRGNELATQRYRLEAGEHQIDLWYTADREWVGLQSRAGEGRTLRYVLQ